MLIPDDRAARAALAGRGTMVGTSLPFRAGASLRVARRDPVGHHRRGIEPGHGELR